jgi:hypothetical protein
MKSGRAAVWADRIIRYEQKNGSPRFSSWADFSAAFKGAFFPENEAVDARMKLESGQYFQSRRSVDAYVDEFEDLVELSGYSDKLTMVVKFRRGLSSTIQDKIAEMGKDRPGDDDPEGWYTAARMFDQNRRANEAFNSSTARRPPPATPSTPSLSSNLMRQNISAPTLWPRTSTASTSAAPPARPLPPGIPMDIDSAKRVGKIPGACYRCGQLGHRSRECPTGFDIRLMSSADRDELLEDLLALKDVSEVLTEEIRVAEVEEDANFGRCSG